MKHAQRTVSEELPSSKVASFDNNKRKWNSRPACNSMLT
jgi:hypothetical protein